MSGPKRIQRKRTKGWRMPEGAIYVGRPGRWGNPLTVGPCGTPQDVVDGYIEHVVWNTPLEAYEELRGHDLACWCPLDRPCHADVLLELANKETL